MSVEDCAQSVKDYLKESGLERKISAYQIDQWANEIRSKGENVLTKAEFASALSKMVEDELTKTQLKDKAAKAIALEKATSSVENTKYNIAKWKEDYQGGKRGVLFKDNPLNIPFEASRVWIQGGSIRAGEGTNLAPSLLRMRAYDDYMGTFRAGIKDIVTETASGVKDRDTLKAIAAIDNNTGRGGLDPIAEKYAKAIIAVRDRIFSVNQSMNPYLEAAQNYFFKQFHDQAKTMKMDKSVWIAKMQERAPESWAGQTPSQKLETWGKVYDRIAKGEWGTSASDESFAREYNQGGNIFRRQSSSRQIVFKDWQAFADHFQELGPGTLYEGLNRVMLKAATESSMLTKFGPNAQETFNRHTNMMLNSLEGSEKENYRKQIPTLQKMFNAAALGAQDAPASEKYAIVAKAVMTQQYLAKISGIYHALQDPLLAASMVRDLNGRTMLGNSFEIANEYFKNMLPGGEARARGIMENLGLYWRSAHSELMAIMGTPDKSVLGKVSGAIETMGSLNLYSRHINAMRAATATVLTKLLGDHADIAHVNLSDRMQQGLSRYGIGPAEWNTMRANAGENLYGHRVLLPENVAHMSDEATRQYLFNAGDIKQDETPSRQKMDRAKFKLSGLLGGMVNDHAEMASASPTERTKYFLWGDNDINSPEGVLRRVFTQFKAASIETNNVYRRSYMSGEGLKGDYAGVAQHAAMALFTAGLAEYAKQLVEQGKTPENPTDPKFVAKMVASSGFGGTFADSLLGAAQRGGAANIAASIGESLLGPTVGSTIEAAGVGIQAMKQIGGAPKDKTLGARAVSLIQSNTPVTNTWAARAMSNFYLWNGLKEHMGPGYLNHLERTTQQTSGLLEDKQRYLWLNPTESPRP